MKELKQKLSAEVCVLQTETRKPLEFFFPQKRNHDCRPLVSVNHTDNETDRQTPKHLPPDQQHSLCWVSDRTHPVSSRPGHPETHTHTQTHTEKHTDTHTHTPNPICYSWLLSRQHQKQPRSSFHDAPAPLRQKYLSRFAPGWNRRIAGINYPVMAAPAHLLFTLHQQFFTGVVFLRCSDAGCCSMTVQK